MELFGGVAAVSLLRLCGLSPVVVVGGSVVLLVPGRSALGIGFNPVGGLPARLGIGPGSKTAVLEVSEYL